jgi:hypothetical protein
MIHPGDQVYLPLTVIRIEDGRLDGQTPDGHLIQVAITNIGAARTSNGAAPMPEKINGTSTETKGRNAKRNSNVAGTRAG